jgi:hypothetical protein
LPPWQTSQTFGPPEGFSLASPSPSSERKISWMINSAETTSAGSARSSL